MRRRDQPPRTLQLTWRNHNLHLWAIAADDGSVAPTHELLRLTDQQTDSHLSIISSPGRMTVVLPAPFGSTPISTLRIPLAQLTVFSADPGSADGSATVDWFVALATLARSCIAAGRLRPTLLIDGAIHHSRWQPVVDDALAGQLAALHAAMPPACGVDDIRTVFELILDALARKTLSRAAWRPPQPRNGRGTDYRAAQSALRALGSDSGNVLYRNDDLAALADLQRTFNREIERASGMAVLAAQLRLALPDTFDDPWRISLELVDVDQPDHWCTAADVRDSTPLALDLARTAEHLPRLGERLATAGAMIDGRLVPTLAPDLATALQGFGHDTGHVAELTLDEVEAFLVAAPDVLSTLDIRLLGPEQLVRAKTGVRAAATPQPGGGAGGRFSAGALVQWDATIDDSPVDDAQLERAALAGSSLVHVNGRWVRLDTKQVRGTLERLQKHRTDHAELDVAALMKLAADAVIADAPGNASDTVQVKGEGWIGDLLAGLPDEQLIEMREPDNFVGELRHYQRRGLSWMAFLSRLGLGGCLADDMGLGKTATTLAHLSTRPGPHLVVCPLSVVHNWYAESARFTPHLQVAIHHGNERARGLDAVDQLVPSDIVVTTYGTLSRDIDSLADVRWGTLVLDEAQNVKNHLTRAAKAIRLITADQKLALTGTPVENNLGELWSILDAVNPGLYGSAHQFNERFAKPIQRNGDETATAALRALTQPFILRRTKADKTLLPELPDKIEQIAWATLTKEQAAMYQAVVDQLLADAQAETGMRRRGLVLAALTRLKQICNHPAHAAGDGSRIAGRSGKLTRFDEIVDDMLELGERGLVFTQFREMGLLLQRHLGERLQMEASFLHGGVSRTGRDTMVRRFQAG
ncbi:MAG: ATP-dependent helicase, partial [Ilumatobacteraceae bacterium]|nr:ATP-dependent helicase [Ilumatobacteraceae bacterium]